MCISTEIASIFPLPILYTVYPYSENQLYIYCYNPMFHTKNNLVIIIMHIYIIIINVLFFNISQTILTLFRKSIIYIVIIPCFILKII